MKNTPSINPKLEDLVILEIDLHDRRCFVISDDALAALEFLIRKGANILQIHDPAALIKNHYGNLAVLTAFG